MFTPGRLKRVAPGLQGVLRLLSFFAIGVLAQFWLFKAAQTDNLLLLYNCVSSEPTFIKGLAPLPLGNDELLLKF